jgi:hypothetical protein
MWQNRKCSGMNERGIQHRRMESVSGTEKENSMISRAGKAE